MKFSRIASLLAIISFVLLVCNIPNVWGFSRNSIFGGRASVHVSASASGRVRNLSTSTLLGNRMASSYGATMDSPSAERNKDPIWEVLEPKFRSLLSDPSSSSGVVLEVAAGTGVHAEYFVSKLSNLVDGEFAGKDVGKWKWVATDPDSRSRGSIDARFNRISSVSTVETHPSLSLSLDGNGIMEKGTSFPWDDGVDMIIW